MERPLKARVHHGLGLLLDDMFQAVLTYQPDDGDIHNFLALYIKAKLEVRKVRQEEEQLVRHYFVHGEDRGLTSLLQNKHVSLEDADKFASKIQAAFRGHLVRKQLEEEGKVLHKEHWKSWEWRRWSWQGPSVLTDTQLQLFLEDLNISLGDANKSANKIQAVYRGYRVRHSTEGKAVEGIIKKRRSSLKPFQRLSGSLIAIHYDVKICPRLDTFTFNGSIFIHMLLTIEESSSIVMNALELTITSALWKDTYGNEYIAIKIDYDETNGTICMQFDSPLPMGRGILHISYWGTMKDDNRGLYYIKMTHGDSESQEGVVESYVAITQFEATEARKAFPCLDEPDRKATFSISLVVEPGKTSISNMPLKNVRPVEEEGFELREYVTTPKMSPYLVAFAVGDFEFVETTSNGVLIRVYTTLGRKEQGQFALQVAAKILIFYTNFFGIAYPLPKLDMVAVPNMACQAMENWGMLVFRETAILFDEKESSHFSKQWIAIVVCHEICHQWFGNLCTMEWWTDLWLNEGFSTYFETCAADHLFPELGYWNQFVKDSVINSMETDALLNSHPVEVEIGHPAEIDSIFDEISYSKGASLIRMLQKYMGEKVFRDGINVYLRAHKYRNVISDYLWAALEKASGKPIGKIMKTWTKKIGFPLIVVGFEKVNGSSTSILVRLTQEKFWANPITAANQSTTEELWPIPLTFSSQSKPNTVIADCLMEQKSVTVLIKNVGDDEWVKVNPGMAGFYRVQYPPEALEKFMSSIKALSMPCIDRLALLDDLFALVKCGQKSTVDLFQFLLCYRGENDVSVWEHISRILDQLGLLLEETEYHDHFKAYEKHLTSLIVENMGWEQKESFESHSESMLRALTIQFRTGSFGDPNAIVEARRRLVQHLGGEKVIEPDIRCAIYTAVLYSPLEGEGDQLFEIMTNLYIRSEMYEEKKRIGQALGALPNPTLLRKVLDFSISKHVMSGDATDIMTAVSIYSKQGRRLVWEFIKEKWDILNGRYSGGSTCLSRVIKHTTQNFMDEYDAEDVEDFFQKNPLHGEERVVAQAVENIRANAAWVSRDLVKVGEYLASLTL